jgi:hypothetical protein
LALRAPRTKWKKRLIENALDFLARAIDDLKEQPKHSIINFYSAVELFLKARLLQEHWSLTVSKDADRQKFEAGDFVSVSFETACERLQNIVQSPISPSARRNFDAVRKHRNKMVHFFHEADQAPANKLEAIAREQLRAWYDLHKLLTVQWSPIFDGYESKFKEIEKKLKGHREFLRAKFHDLAPAIKLEQSRGSVFKGCGSCSFKATRVTGIIGDLSDGQCLVCGYRDQWFAYTCSECSKVSSLREGGEFVCPHCNHKDNTEAIFDNINEFVATPDNYVDALVPANCAECESYHSVAEYKDQFLCVVCFCVTEHVAACGWCSEYGNGDMEHSSLFGCSLCDGSVGNQMSKDD